MFPSPSVKRSVEIINVGVKRLVTSFKSQVMPKSPTTEVGNFVLVHAGFAIEVVDAEYAQETIDLIKQFPELVGEEV